MSLDYRFGIKWSQAVIFNYLKALFNAKSDVGHTINMLKLQSLINTSFGLP